MKMLDIVRERALAIWEDAGLMERRIEVVAAPLTVEQAIGKPAGQDFPIQKGKEKLMEARFGDARGQAFTDTFGNYSGRLADISRLDLGNQMYRAVFVATLNAVMREMGRAERTIHCKDEGPAICSGLVADHIRETYGAPKIGLVGYQPGLIAGLKNDFDVRVLDLDPDNIGTSRQGVPVEGGEATDGVMAWADLMLVTGTTLANDSIDMFLQHGEVLFYGTTIAGAADIMGWKRFCPCGF